MSPDTRLLADIGGAEGNELTAYKDSLGLWTIGKGHLLDQSKDWTGVTWTQEKVDAVFANDVELAVIIAQRCLEWPFLDTDCRRNALCELVFNLGQKRWLGFVNTRAAIRARDWQTAHDELLNSAWASQVHLTRANRIANYLLTGEYP